MFTVDELFDWHQKVDVLLDIVASLLEKLKYVHIFHVYEVRS